MTAAIIDAIEARRCELDMTITKLVKRAGLTRATYVKILSRKTLNSEMLDRLAFALDTDVRTLAGDTGLTPPPEEVTLRRVRDLIGPKGLEEPKWLHDAIEMLWRSQFFQDAKGGRDERAD